MSGSSGWRIKAEKPTFGRILAGEVDLDWLRVYLNA